MYLVRLCFSFSGRVNRAKYWLGMAIAFCIQILGMMSLGLQLRQYLTPSYFGG
jgi:uncharacterized membrane protein YhaH (DUF805 family)